MSQVGKPAPPRPRRPEALSSFDDVGRLHLEERPLEAGVAVAGDVLVDVLGVDDAAVAQHDAELLLVEVESSSFTVGGGLRPSCTGGA